MTATLPWHWQSVILQWSCPHYINHTKLHVVDSVVGAAPLQTKACQRQATAAYVQHSEWLGKSLQKSSTPHDVSVLTSIIMSVVCAPWHQQRWIRSFVWYGNIY